MAEISLQDAEKIAERLEKANAESKLILERAEKLRVQEILGGKSNAGLEEPQLSETERIKKEAKEFFKGSDIEKALEKHG